MTIDARKIRLIMKLRRNGVSDTRVLSAIERVPREAFIPEMFHDQAYEDMALPIGLGQTISQPLVVATMTQALELGDRDKVLEIGTGSGYQTAILAKLCRRVYSIERHRPLLVRAEKVLQGLGIHNLTVKVGDGMKGWKEQAPFDRIIVTAGALGEPPRALLEQLKVGGIMVIPVGRISSSQMLVKITRTEEGYKTEDIFPVRFVPLLPDVPGDQDVIDPALEKLGRVENWSTDESDINNGVAGT